MPLDLHRIIAMVLLSEDSIGPSPLPGPVWTCLHILRLETPMCSVSRVVSQLPWQPSQLWFPNLTCYIIHLNSRVDTQFHGCHRNEVLGMSLLTAACLDRETEGTHQNKSMIRISHTCTHICAHARTHKVVLNLDKGCILLNSLSEMLSHTYYSHHAKILWQLYITIRTELIGRHYIPNINRMINDGKLNL